MNARALSTTAARTAAKTAKETGAAGGRAAYLKARRSAARAPLQARLATTKARLAVAKRRPAKTGNVTRGAGAAGIAGIAGAVGGYFIDPENGTRRRNLARDRIVATARRTAEKLRRQAEHRKNQAEGKVEAAKSTSSPAPAPANEQALAARVMSEVFRPAGMPKKSVSVNAEDGVIYLRGEVPDTITMNRVIAATEAVDGVDQVKNLLHLPGARAPMKS
jgi:osmotically-inducible protein OsmY